MFSHNLENHLGKYSHSLDFLLHFTIFKHIKSSFLFLNSYKFATLANILTKKLINQFEIQIAHEQGICTFNVQTMNMVFNASTIWKNHQLVLTTMKLCFFKPCSIESSLWSIHHLKTSSNPSQLLFPLSKIGSIKAMQFHQIMVQHLQSCTIIHSLSCSKYCLRLLGISPNQGVIIKEQNEHIK